jgi:hypothetical protein
MLMEEWCITTAALISFVRDRVTGNKAVPKDYITNNQKQTSLYRLYIVKQLKFILYSSFIGVGKNV